MSDDNFSLERLREGIGKRREELEHEDDKNARSMDDISRQEEGPTKPFTSQHSNYDRTEAPKDAMRQYWRQFETTPIIRKPITSFASQVTEPGYYIQAEGLDEDTLKTLDHWLQRAAIIEGEVGKDFRLLAKKSVIQREVRGTALVEKAPSRTDEDEIAGLKLINPETMEAVTRPGQSILLAPDDDERGDLEDVPMADSGKGAAAYLQDLSETNTLFGTPVSSKHRDGDEGWKIAFTRNEIVKLTRDADVGEPFGTSRIESVTDRIEGIKKKLHDNDEAIESKAYPLWLFLFGDPETTGVWDSDDINDFMSSQEMDQFHPGMKQGVRGDVSVETISGEVADISESLQFDLDWVMSAMPLPKYSLGSFETGAVGQVGGVAQQQDVNRQINEARQELEEEFSPVLREVAMQNGVSEEDAKDIYLKIGEPGEPETEVPRRENIIRYVPEDQREPSTDDGSPQQQDAEGDGNQTVDDGIVGADGAGDEDSEPSEEAGARVWHTNAGVAELSMDDDNQTKLADELFELFVEARERSLDTVERKYNQTPAAAVTGFESTANRVTSRLLGGGRFKRDVKPVVRDVVTDIEERMGQETPQFTRGQNVQFYTQDIGNSVEDALDEMMRQSRIQVRRGAVNNEEWPAIRSRVEEKFNDANLRQRAELIAHMELRNAVETTKLQQWEQSPEVIGVRLQNEDASTPLTQSLHNARALFERGDIREQWMEQTREEYLHKGFDPLPPTPPFHFNDTTTMEPIRR